MTIALDVLTLLTTILCAALLLRAYQNVRKRLLLWSGLCFCGLAMQNLALVLDLAVFPMTDLRIARIVPALFAIALLLFGLIWETER
jgi:hypothetical protein